MTDAELRRALDYSEGDEVYFTASEYKDVNGVIDRIAPAKYGRFFIYSICVKDDNGHVKFIQAQADQIKFKRHADE